MNSRHRNRPLRRLAALLLPISWIAAAGADESLSGTWQLELTNESNRYIGELVLERTAGAWSGFVEGGPVGLQVEGNEIRLAIDTRDIRGFSFERILEGRLEDDELSGTYSIAGGHFPEDPGGTWTARRKLPTPPPKPPSPVDMSGIWKPAPGIDLRKYSMSLTPDAETWFAGYMHHYDQPNVRCVSTGIVAMVAWGFYPMEILASDERLTFLYEVESEVRRVYLDGREPPEFYPTSPMGWSTGHWDGSELVVETQLLEGNVRDFRGEPVSDGARMQERYSLSDDGQVLSAVITLDDPKNYQRPPIRRREWRRSPDTVFYPYECDPDSFYRQMYDEDKLEMYFERSIRRQIE